jgi:hypothetical protein
MAYAKSPRPYMAARILEDLCSAAAKQQNFKNAAYFCYQMATAVLQVNFSCMMLILPTFGGCSPHVASAVTTLMCRLCKGHLQSSNSLITEGWTCLLNCTTQQSCIMHTTSSSAQ